MKVYVRQQGLEVDLTQRDLVGAGGEGTVYAKCKLAYKIYHDSKRMLPVGKIKELSAITDPFVVRPLAIVTDKAGSQIGYTTTFVPNAWTLCQLFPLSFRQRENLTPDTTRELVKKLQEHVSNVHTAGILIVDLNEMNFLVDKPFKNVYCIDVDSYQTPSYPAPAIMESIRDWSAKEFTDLSDWYSFGVLAFQMFVGLHPYKGRYHGKQAGFKARLATDADDDTFAVTRRRMQANVSVFHPDVGVPGACLPFDTIPAAYRSWFENMFAKGQRCPPPVEGGKVIVPVVLVPTVTGTATLDIAEVGSYEGVITHVWSDGGRLVVSTASGVWIDSARTKATSTPYCCTAPKSGRVVAVARTGSATRLYNATDGVDLGPLGLTVEEVSSHDGRVYLRTQDHVHELVLTDVGAQLIASTREVVQTLPHATRLFPGVVVQRLLGTTYASLLTRAGASQQVAIKELDAYRVLDAKFDRGVLMVVGEKKGKYDRLVFRFEGSAYDLRVVAGVAYCGLNFVTLDTGVCVCLTESEELEVFTNRVGSKGLRIVQDKALDGSMRLWSRGGSVLFSLGSRLYSMRLK